MSVWMRTDLISRYHNAHACGATSPCLTWRSTAASRLRLDQTSPGRGLLKTKGVESRADRCQSAPDQRRVFGATKPSRLRCQSVWRSRYPLRSRYTWLSCGSWPWPGSPHGVGNMSKLLLSLPALQLRFVLISESVLGGDRAPQNRQVRLPLAEQSLTWLASCEEPTRLSVVRELSCRSRPPSRRTESRASGTPARMVAECAQFCPSSITPMTRIGTQRRTRYEYG
jgi:hypothetical protein